MELDACPPALSCRSTSIVPIGMGVHGQLKSDPWFFHPLDAAKISISGQRRQLHAIRRRPSPPGKKYPRRVRPKFASLFIEQRHGQCDLFSSSAQTDRRSSLHLLLPQSSRQGNQYITEPGHEPGRCGRNWNHIGRVLRSHLDGLAAAAQRQKVSSTPDMHAITCLNGEQ